MFSFEKCKNTCPWKVTRERRVENYKEDNTLIIENEETIYCKGTGMECKELSCAPLHIFREGFKDYFYDFKI